MQIEEQKSNLHMMNVGINIWDDYSEEKPKFYKNKLYHTYAYVEYLKERMNINGEIEYISYDELYLTQDDVFNMQKDILIFLQNTLIQEKLIKDNESFIEIFDPLIAYDYDFTLPFWKTREGVLHKRNLENSKRYQLFFTNLPYEKLEMDIQCALDKFNQQKLSFKKENYFFNLNIYSES